MSDSRMQPSNDRQLAPGTVLFGEYEIIGPLGGGGMGSVYRARHRSLSSLRAIKVIRSDLVADPKVEELFIREAHALMGIHHQAVVRCHDLLRENGRIYLIMELVQGASLEDILRGGPLSADEVRALKRRMASGLEAAHRGGIVHRDISPGNIILPNNDPEQAKLIDFGVASVSTVTGKTMVGDFKGKLAYASPEQFGLFGAKVDERSDLYSLGLVLAEAATAQQLPMGQTFYEALELRKSVPRIPPDVPTDLRDEILPLLEPDPARRPQSAAELLESPKPRTAAKSSERAPSPDAQPKPGWLASVLYSATAVGVGIGLGLMLWMWKAGLALPGSMSPAPVAPQKNVAPQPAVQPKASVPPLPVAARPVRAGGSIARSEMLDTAQRLASHTWNCGANNTVARCIRGAYRSDFSPGQRVAGIPYAWGGIDGPEDFNTKINRGYAAGSHARHGVAQCTAGMDCSGFIAYCWGRRTHAVTTATLGSIAQPIRGNVYSDLKPGDALNKPGKHVVLFAGYRPDGGPIVYEASGSHGRVIRNERSSWARFRSYRAMQFRDVMTP